MKIHNCFVRNRRRRNGVHGCDDAKWPNACMYQYLRPTFGTRLGRSRCSASVHLAAPLLCVYIYNLLIARQARMNYESQLWQRKPNFPIPLSACVHAAYAHKHKPTEAQHPPRDSAKGLFDT